MRRTATLVAVVGALVVLFAGAALAAAIDGTNRADKLVGTEGADTIRGFRGDDTVYGRGGSDRLVGNPGSDTAYGGEGDDTLEMRDGVAGNDMARCGLGNDVARVDSGAEVFGTSTPWTPVGQREDAYCETVEYRAEARGVLEPGSELCNLYCYGTHRITDEASNALYELESETVDLQAHVGRRVTVSGPVTDPQEGPPLMKVTRIEER